jgi:hypothetical protein
MGGGWPIVQLPGPDHFCNPIGKVFKRVDNGAVDSVVAFYDIFCA